MCLFMNVCAEDVFTGEIVQHRETRAVFSPETNAKHLLNGNGDALNTLFWWRKCCNYGSWEGHSFVFFWRIFGAWWNRNKYVINTAKSLPLPSHSSEGICENCGS